jgi:Xaa-Pro aminopeptidase
MALILDGDRTIGLVRALEINRLKGSSGIDDLVSWDVVRNSLSTAEASEFCVLRRFLENYGFKSLCVKRNFPIDLADKLRANDFRVKVEDFAVLPQRLIKTPAEVIEIRRATEIVDKVFARVREVLGASTVNLRDELIFAEEPLTSERLRAIMEDTCYQLGAIAEDTIVACGDDACDPHQIGSGALKRNQFILVDFFPRLRTSGYYADVSRTFIKGTPSGHQIRLYNTVKVAHDMAIDMVGDGVQCKDIMAKVMSYFEDNGYKSDKTSSPPHGMFHSLGHGFGLDIHEPPRLGFCDDVLKTGMTVTIEPGLYYHGIGGVRIEDDILVESKSRDILSKVPYDWVIQ